MIDIKYTPDHHVQRYILDTLRHSEYARFRDLRPAGVDSNAYTYHLNKLIKQDFVRKTEYGYTLSLRGMVYIDRVSSINTRPRQQPKIMTMTIIQDEGGEVLVRRKTSQPMINQVTYSCGMQHMEDATIRDAALREVAEKMALTLDDIEHIGDCYMAIRHGGQVIMNTLIHVFYTRVSKSNSILSGNAFWRSIDDLSDAAPATRHVTKELLNREPGKLFFREYAEELE